MTSDENIIDRLAAPDSLLGMLQRGRGAGYLAALDAPRETVWPLLLECMTSDTRLCPQCEDRAEYYASLILATGMDLMPIYSYLKQNDNLENDVAIASSLPLGTLVALAERSSREALQMLRDYVSFGWDWTYVVLVLWDLGEPAILEGIDETICRRVISSPGEQLEFRAEVEEDWQRYCDGDAEQRSRYRLVLPVCEPWKTLCQRNNNLAGLFEGIGIAYDEPPPAKVKPTYESLAALSLRELFDRIDKSNRVRVLNVLEEKVSAGDENLLLQNVSSDNKYRVKLALRGLGILGTPKAIKVAKAYVEAGESVDPGVRVEASDALGRMPAALMLDTGRQWFRRKEWYLQVAGGTILENHATVEDIPMLIHALRNPEAVGWDGYRLTGALIALARFSGIGPIPELEQIFRGTPSCFDRHDAAKAMAVTAPAQFCSEYAFECLWDCEGNTRELGCETVDLSMPGAPERLREIAEDTHEDDRTREVAQRRLQEL